MWMMRLTHNSISFTSILCSCPQATPVMCLSDVGFFPIARLVAVVVVDSQQLAFFYCCCTGHDFPHIKYEMLIMHVLGYAILSPDVDDSL